MMTRNGPANSPPAASPGGGYARGVILILLAGVLWSTMGIGVRMIEHASAIQILFYRSVGILPVLFAFIAVRSGGHPLRVIAQTGIPAILGGIGLIIAFGGGVISLVETTVANAVFLFSVAPLVTALLALIFLGERIRLGTWLTMLVAGIGVLIMVVDGISLGRTYGNVAALTSATGFATFTLSLRWERSGDALPAVLLAGIYAVLAFGTAVLVSGQSLLVPLRDAGIATCMGAVTLSGGLMLYSLGARHVAAGEASLLSLLEVVLAPIWVFLLLGEGAGIYTLVGGGILLLALVGNALTGLFGQRRAGAPKEEFEDGERLADDEADDYETAPDVAPAYQPIPLRQPPPSAYVRPHAPVSRTIRSRPV